MAKLWGVTKFQSDSADEEDMDKDELTKEEIEDEKNDLLNEADIPLEELMKMYQVPQDAATNESEAEVRSLLCVHDKFRNIIKKNSGKIHSVATFFIFKRTNVSFKILVNICSF